jgi:hypothetical protein
VSRNKLLDCTLNYTLPAALLIASLFSFEVFRLDRQNIEAINCFFDLHLKA